MHDKVKKYLNNFDAMPTSDDGSVKINSVAIDVVKPQSLQQKAGLCKINNQSVFVKKWNKTNSVINIATSNMYGNIGVLTPRVHVLYNYPSYRRFLGKNKLVDNRFGGVSTFTKDATSMPAIECDTIDHIFSKEDKYCLPFTLGHYQWKALYFKDVRDVFLKYMTPQCFDELVGECLMAELRTDIDRNFENQLLYKRRGGDKYEGVIPIDFENVDILKHIGNGKVDKSKFVSFLVTPYTTATMTGGLSWGGYASRLKDIKEVISDGMVSKENIAKLKDYLNYDMRGEILKTYKGEECSKTIKSVAQMYDMLWEYNRKELDKELSL